MKKIALFLSFILLINYNVSSQNENPFTNVSFEKAKAQAVKAKKPLLIDFYTVWCGACKAYDKYVFSKPEIKSYIKNKFIALSIDAEKGEGVELGKSYNINSFPQIIIADPSGKEIDRISGFDSKYSENPQEFINKVNSILDGTNTILHLENDVRLNPNNSLLKEKLIHEYIARDQYSKIPPYAKELMQLKDSTLKIKGEYFNCYSLLEDKKINDPNPMIKFLSKKSLFLKEFIGLGYSALLNFYSRKGDIQNTDFYYQKVITADTSDWYHKKKYAKFLFENNMNIAKAQQIAEEYYKTPDLGDHYQPLLMAYSFSSKNEIEKGMKIFDEWMKQTLKWSIDDKQWAYYYYSDFANNHNIRLDKALEYAKQVSDFRGQDIECNILLANLLVKNNQTQSAIDILNKSLEYVQAKSHYSEITDLIRQYKSKK